MSNTDRYLTLRPNFALTPTQSFLLSSESRIRQPLKNQTKVNRYNLQGAKGLPLSSPMPEAQKIFMIYTAVEILNHESSIPKGFINHTTWEAQNLPLVALEREIWDNHQLVPWTGSEPVWVELTINNIDGTGHPFHLVGLWYHLQNFGTAS
jgi:FtsP/CotA-like multicopper oxidase with cupredoxin domain